MLIPTKQVGLGQRTKEPGAMAEINQAEVMDALRECYDPEIPVNVVDLGAIWLEPLAPAATAARGRMKLSTCA